VIFGAFTGAALGYLWPLVLILVGVILVYRTFASRRSAQ
jgi:positive regulator of sigma E activity